MQYDYADGLAVVEYERVHSYVSDVIDIVEFFVLDMDDVQPLCRETHINTDKNGRKKVYLVDYEDLNAIL